MAYTKEQQAEIDAFKLKLPEMSDEDLYRVARKYIWLSAYASNNPRSAYHPMCDATFDEAKRRGKLEIYSRAHADESAAVGG